MPTPLNRLRSKLAPIEDLKNAAEVLAWDQETNMPDGGAEARAYQLSTLQRIAHERFTSDEIGALLDAAADQVEEEEFDPDSTPARLVQITRRDYDRARKLPSSLVSELANVTTHAKQAWKQARQEDDFECFAPHLERIVELNRQKAEALDYDDEPYDALLDEYEPGMATDTVATTFHNLRIDLLPIVKTIAAQAPPDDRFLHQPFDPDRQRAFGEQVIRDFGFDFDRGRQDTSAHPFSTAFSIRDVRLTSRYDPGFFPSGFFATLHEAGHGLYEQGIASELERTPLADGTSLGVHESQSRLWENFVGRSRPFWQHYYPKLQATFPSALKGVPKGHFFRAINKVEPSLIRVEADEVTYNLHVMLRFELERALIEDDLDVSDLPAAWNEKMDAYLGVQPETDVNGVLQDVHWALGSIGYFPTYALGNLMSAQIFARCRADLPNLDEQLAEGTFAPLLTWLRRRIYRHGRKFKAPELLRRVTGTELRADAWIEYIRTKFGTLYDGV